MVSSIKDSLDSTVLVKAKPTIKYSNRRKWRFKSGSGISYFKSIDVKLNLGVTGYRNADFIPITFWSGFEWHRVSLFCFTLLIAWEKVTVIVVWFDPDSSWRIHTEEFTRKVNALQNSAAVFF